MNDIGFIILLIFFGIVLLICLYWCCKHSQENQKVNNKTRWNLIKFLNKNPEVLPV